MSFDLRASIPMEVMEEDGLPKITVAADVLYPILIRRIRDVLAGADEPVELGISTYLVQEALLIPDEAWEDALLRREEFHEAAFSSFAVKGKPNYAMIGLLQADVRPSIERMVWRGLALDLTRRWFTRSLPNVFGNCALHIVDPIKFFRL